MRCLPPYHNPEEQKYTKTMGEILQFPFNNLQNSSAARPLESSEIGLIRGGVSPRRPPMGFVLQPESFVLEGYWMEKNHSHFLSFWSSNCHQMILNIGTEVDDVWIHSRYWILIGSNPYSDLPQSSLFEKREKRGLEFVESPVLDWKRRPNFWYKYLGKL